MKMKERRGRKGRGNEGGKDWRWTGFEGGQAGSSEEGSLDRVATDLEVIHSIE